MSICENCGVQAIKLTYSPKLAGGKYLCPSCYQFLEKQDWSPYPPSAEAPSKCECGAHKANIGGHSFWCPEYK